MQCVLLFYLTLHIKNIILQSNFYMEIKIEMQNRGKKERYIPIHRLVILKGEREREI